MSYDAAPSEVMRRVRVEPPLPCSTRGCSRLASIALAEPDPMFPGLWQLLPLCEVCRAERAVHALPSDVH